MKKHSYISIWFLGGAVVVILSLIIFSQIMPDTGKGKWWEFLMTSSLDQDGDGMRNAFEQAYTSPPSSTALNPLNDEDTDGFKNLTECRNGMDPTLYDYDSDSDGLPDSFELRYSSSSTAMTATGDDDYGGTYNYQEFLDGTNPVDSGDDGSEPSECDILS